MAEKKLIIGIDIGGTNIRIGLVDPSYRLQYFEIADSQSILSEKPKEGIKQFLVNYGKRHPEARTAAAIAIGSPSTLDKEKKRILSTPNINGMDNLDLADDLGKYFGIPVFLNKDVNMLMQYDMFQQKLPKNSTIVGVYFGTGIGNAIYINGKILSGKNGAAAELGHIPVMGKEEQCGCGNYGCIELYASGKYLANLKKKKYPDTKIEDMFAEHGEDDTMREYISNMAIPVATEINILDPDYVIIGGGIPQMKEFPAERLKNEILRFTRRPYPREGLSIIYAVPKQENGVIGAGIYGNLRLEEKYEDWNRK